MCQHAGTHPPVLVLDIVDGDGVGCRTDDKTMAAEAPEK